MAMDDANLELFARCAGGFEDVLADELRSLGMRRVRPLRGGVSFFGSRRDAYVACLWSRVATRIQLVLARIGCSDADELYREAAAFRWERHVRDGATIAIVAHGTNANLRNTQFTALKVKDALCDRLREVRGVRPNVDAKQPDFLVSVTVHERRSTLALDLSGESLHRRGYREDGVQTEAPLKETLAASILLAAGWQELAGEGGYLVDPMCGSGTFAIEGAMMAADIAPGLLRDRWGFEGWVRHDRKLWDELLAEAHARKETGGARPCVIAGDLDAKAVEIARANAERAGVSRLVRFHQGDAALISRHLKGVGDAPGLLVANPPYGIRLLSPSELPRARQALASAVDSVPKGWRIALITPDLGIETALGRVPSKVIPCFNGPIETWARLYDAADPRQTIEVVSLSGRQRHVAVADTSSTQFASRLRKVAKERSRWAKREHVSCYRLYDADLPEYAVSVDLLSGEGPDEGKVFAIIEERPRPKRVDVLRSGRRFYDAAAIVSAVLDVDGDCLVLRPWVTDTLYDRVHDSSGAWGELCVGEGGRQFSVDLGGTSGKALPLELREVRSLVAKLSEGASFANLFASGNAATVCAADAGASSTVTVDASQERLEWTEHALLMNNLMGKRQRFACMDVREWLDREARAHHTYDLVLCSPPSRLAAHGAKGRAWDLEEDLPALLAQVRRVLSAEGRVVLVLPPQGAVPSGGFAVEDLTARMVPHDFERAREHPRVLLLSPTGGAQGKAGKTTTTHTRKRR